jgi:TRAP-type mannitol/chloroaromatic compound transport system permease large subunit
LIRPKWVPALPPEARSYQEADGSSGFMSLAALMAVVTAVGVVVAQGYDTMMAALQGVEPSVAATDEKVVVAVSIAAGLALFLAIVNRVLKLGLLSKMAEDVTFVLIPPLGLIFLVLGTIFLGIATPTEGGAMGAAGALLMAVARQRLDFKTLIHALESTTRLSCFVLFILIGSTVFSFIFTAVDGQIWVEHLFDKLPGGELGFLLFVNVVIFVLGFFLDFFEIAFILVPLLAPVAENMGIDLIWFGIIIAINLQTSFLSPPFGFAMFCLRSVVPANRYTDRITNNSIEGITTMQIYRGSIPFLIIQLAMLSMLIAFPQLVTSGLSKKVDVDLDTIEIEVPATEGGWGADPGGGWGQ